MIKALSLWQPWASLIAIGAKQYETRGWSTAYRGDLVIHAAKTRQAMDLCFDQPFLNTLLQNGIFGTRDIPLGAALCIARLEGVYPTHLVRGKITATEEAFGDWSDGRYCWHLTDIRLFPAAIPYRGAQGLFEYTGPLPMGGNW